LSRKNNLILIAFKHKLRQKIVDVLDTQDMMTATEICSKIKSDARVVIHHLTILSRVGAVVTHQTDEVQSYTLDRDKMGEISRRIDDLNRLRNT